MGYKGTNGSCHNGKQGIHLYTDNCPTGCYSLSDDNFTGETIQAKQDSINGKLASDGFSGSLEIVIEGVNPLKYKLVFKA